MTERSKADVVFTGCNPYVPRRPHVCGTIVRPDRTLYLGTRCYDGRPIEESRRYLDAVRLGARILKHTVVEDTEDSHSPVVSSGGKSLLEKYRPKKLASVIGHATEIAQLRTWIRSWPAQGRVVLIHGSPGIGKTTIAHLLGKEAGYDRTTEYNASDVRSVSALRAVLGGGDSSSSSGGIQRLQRELIVMDEVDGLAERGGVVELAAIAQKTMTPMICIANELGQKLKPLERVCGRQVIAFAPVPPAILCPALEQLCRAENIRGFDRATIRTLYDETGGDIRHLLNHLDFHSITSAAFVAQKDRPHDDLYQTTAQLLTDSNLSWDQAMDRVYHEEYMVPLMIQENYVLAGSGTVTMNTLAEAADHLSLGDLARSMLGQTQDWSILPVVVGCCVGATKCVQQDISSSSPSPKVRARFPAILGKQSTQHKNERWLYSQPTRTGVKDRLDGALELLVRRQTHALLEGSRESIRSVVENLKERGWTREDLTEMAGGAFCLYPLPAIPSKTKAALTRALGQKVLPESRSKKRPATGSDSDSDSDPEHDSD